MTSPPFYLSREHAAVGADRELRKRAASGELARVVRGVFVPAAEWEALDPVAQYRLSVCATARLEPTTVFSHESAAALWELPFFGPPPVRFHSVIDRSNGGRSVAGLIRHATGLDEGSTIIDGARVTSLPRTLADIACQPGFTRALVMIDRGLQGIRGTPVLASEISQELAKLGRVPGFARAARVLAFATPLSGSVGESVSRSQILALGLPIPELQVPFYDEGGLIGIADFYWRHLDLVGEFDGGSKYGPERQFKRDVAIADLVEAERDRERRMRRVTSGLVRWDWPVAMNRDRLAARLAEHGVVRARTRGSGAV